MKIKTRSFIKTKLALCSDGVNRNITVYGELEEYDHVDGVCVVPCAIKGKSKPIEPAVNSNKWYFVPSMKSNYGRTKDLYLGFSICSPEDDFDQNIAIRNCKRRFKSPISTQNGRMLTPDMIDAIIENEIKYISSNIELFLPKEK